MRKEVFYSLAALSLAPVAANAAEGTVIPGFVTGNKWTGDIDGSNSNGIVQWVKGDVVFTVNQELVPGSYTFTCRVKNPGAAVRFYVNDELMKTKEISGNYETVEFEFTLDESVTGLKIKANGVIDFNEGQSNDYYITFAKENNALVQGLQFNRSNFQNFEGDPANPTWTTWKQPLAGINNAIDTYVNKTLTYESDAAKKVMTAEKEKIQNSLAPAEKLTYAFYKDNHLYDPTVNTNPIYIEATNVYNEATRIEAEYQADKIKEKVQEYLDANTEKDANGKPIAGKEDPVAKALADKLIGANGDINAYKSLADAKTGSTKAADGSFSLGADAPVTFVNKVVAEGGFDIDPTASPLKEMIADANSLTAKNNQGAATQNAGKVAEALQAAFQTVEDADSVLIDMFGATDGQGGQFNNVATMALNDKLKTKSQHYLDSAMQITAYYKGLVEGVFNTVKATDIQDMNAAFLADIQKKLKYVNDELAYTATAATETTPFKYAFTKDPLKKYADVYNNYVTKKAAAVGGIVEPELTDIAKEWLENYTVNGNKVAKTAYEAKLAAFRDSVKAATESIKVPDLITPEKSNTDPKNYVALVDTLGNTYKGTTLREPKNTTVTDGTAADAQLLNAFAAYCQAIDSIAKAFAWADSVKAVVDEAYEAAGEIDGYDNRNYFLESYKFATLKSTTNGTGDNATTTLSLEKKVSLPGKAGNGEIQQANQWDYWTFLEGVRNEVERLWTSKDKKYTGTVEQYVLGTKSGDGLAAPTAIENKSGFKYTMDNFFALFKVQANPNQTNTYQKAGVWFAKNYADFYNKFEAYRAAVEKLRTKVAPLPLYTAKPTLYPWDNLYGRLEDQTSNTHTYAYTLPTHVSANGEKMTYKQILAKYDSITKAINDSIASFAAKYYDNATTKDYRSNMLSKVFNPIRAIVGAVGVEPENYFMNGADYLDKMLADVDWFVDKNGIIDQQAKAYADVLPEDNFSQLMEYIGGDGTVEGVLVELENRLDADNDGGGYEESENNELIYKVGIDTDLDGKVAAVEGVDIADLINEAQKLGFDGKTKLSQANVEYIQQLYKAYDAKYKEAKTIYDKYVAIPPTTKQEFEQANGELGVAIAIINELNDSLASQLEPAIMEEAQALFMHKTILGAIGIQPANATDGQDMDYQAGMVDYMHLNLGKWWNGRKGVTKKVMTPNAPIYLSMFEQYAEAELLNGGVAAEADGFAEDLADVQENWSDGDKALYNELKQIYGSIANVYKALDQAYRTRDFSAWNLKYTPANNNDPAKYEINNADLNVVENQMKAWVEKCVAAEKNLKDNLKALFTLMTNSNYDDDVNENWDWIDLIQQKDGQLFQQYVLQLISQQPDANVETIIASYGNNPIVIRNLFNLQFEMIPNAQLLQTSGILALLEHDGGVKFASDLLEPITVVNGDTINLHTYYNMLADSTNYNDPDKFAAAAARAMVAAANNNPNGSLYLELKQFIEDVNTMYKNRTLGTNLTAMQKRFDDLAQNILLIDEHALANKEQHDRMMVAVKSELAKIGDKEDPQPGSAQATVNAMPDGAAKTAANQQLDNARNTVNGFKDDCDDDYEAGKAWETGETTADSTKVWEDRERAEIATAVQEFIDKATGKDGSIIAGANETAYNKFQSAYAEANLEYSLLVKKLEQLKNLNSGVPQDPIKDAAQKATEDANVFLFGKKDPTAADIIATETAKDKLDKIYQAGTDAYNATAPATADDPVASWSDEYQTALDGVKNPLNLLILEVDEVIEKALAKWTKGDHADKVYKAADADFQKYLLYLPQYAALMKTQPAADAPNGVKAEWAAKDTVEVLKVVDGNPVYKALYDQATALDAKVDLLKEKTLTLKGQNGPFKTWNENQMLDINNLFAVINDQNAIDGDPKNFQTQLTTGKDTAAVRDAKIYIDYATKHLKGDTTWLKKNGFPLDEVITGATETMQAILTDFDDLLFNADETAKEITAANHDNLIGAKATNKSILGIIGAIEKTTDEDGKLTGAYKWLLDGRCAFVHNLKENADSTNKEAMLKTLDALVASIDEARKYIQNYQVAPKFAEELQDLEDLGDAIKEIASSKDAQDIAISIKDEVERYKNLLGTVLITAEDSKKLEDYANVIGTMNAEASTEDGVAGKQLQGLPGIVKRAFEAEKKHLEADINEMRAEYKELPAAQQTDELNAAIEALWQEVEAAVCDTAAVVTSKTVGTTTTTYKDFNGWKRTDLVALQNKVKALYKQIREASNNDIDTDALIANLDGRIAKVKTAVADDYAAGAPTVKKLQEELDALIAEYETVRDSVDAEDDADNFVDYNREKLEAMVQNAENKFAERNADAKKVADMKKAKDDAMKVLYSDRIKNSKAIVNAWLNDIVGIEPNTSLAENENSKTYYDAAAKLIERILVLEGEIVNGYDYSKNIFGQYVYNEPTAADDELVIKNADLDKAIIDAEDAAARYDLGARLSDMTAMLQELILKFMNNEFDPTTTADAQAEITSIQEAITNQSTALKTDPRTKFADILAQIEAYAKNAKGEVELQAGTILYRILALAETLSTNVIGDMDGNGRVTLLDARWIADIAMARKDMPAIGSAEFDRANIVKANGGEAEVIDMADAAAAVNIFFYGDPAGKDAEEEAEPQVLARSSAKENISVEATKTAEGLTRLAISLDNAQAYTAFQMDLQLADGMKFAGASLSERSKSQILLTNEIDGVLRIGAFSLRNDAFAGNSGAVLYLDFEVAEGAEENFARFNDVFFVNKKAQKVSFNLGGITPTGIQSANAETALGQKIYDLGGRMKSSLKKGVNIIRDAAGNARKVIVK